MKKSAVIFIVLFSSLLFASSRSGEEGQSKKGSELVEQLVPMITSILQGEDYTQFKENISPGTYVIYDNNYESIYEVLGNSSKKENFIEGEKMDVGLIHMWIPDDGNSAYMILERKTADDSIIIWHSILFKLDKNQKWKILSWHKS